MSLFCAERNRGIDFGASLYAATRSDLSFFTAFCGEVFDQIPEGDRCPHPCVSDKGVDIHAAFSTRNFTGTYTICDFRKKEFLFSLPEDVAKKYLPRICRYFQRGEAP